MIGKIIIVFAAGFVIDLLVTKYTDFVARRMRGKASVLSGIITIAEFFLLTIILRDSASSDFLSLIAFASGNSLGTFWALKRF